MLRSRRERGSGYRSLFKTMPETTNRSLDIDDDANRQLGVSLLLIGGTATAAASLLHVAIIFGGPAWYRFFGAGERMAWLAARGALSPTVATLTIAIILGVWALYAFSGAGVTGPLPFQRHSLYGIAAVFLTRGILGVPFVLFADHPYANELRARMTFMIVTSVISVALGLCFLIGTRLAGYRPSAARR